MIHVRKQLFRGTALKRVRLDENAALLEVRKAIGEVSATLKTRDTEIATTLKKATDEVAAMGKMTEETKALLTKQADDGVKVQARLIDLEQKFANIKTTFTAPKILTPGNKFIEDEKVKNWIKDRPRGRISVVTNTITSLTTGDGGAGDLVVPHRVPGIIETPTRRLTIRDLLPVGRTTSNSIEFVQETGFTNAAAPVAEGAVKPESSLNFQLQTAPVRTIAHVMKASLQILADVPQLQSFIDTRLRIGLKIEEEDQLLSGDGTGQNLLGLIPQATPYDTARSRVGDTRIDIIRRAMTQLRLAEYQPTGLVLHPTDWEEIELTKESGTGAYVWANPRGLLAPTLWGLPVVDSTALTEGEFLVGAFNVAAQIWDRQDAIVEVSTEDEDNFRRNLVTIRGEERIALTVYRPESFIFGDFDSIVSS